jgi:hypothetical protein
MEDGNSRSPGTIQVLKSESRHSCRLSLGGQPPRGDKNVVDASSHVVRNQLKIKESKRKVCDRPWTPVKAHA